MKLLLLSFLFIAAKVVFASDNIDEFVLASTDEIETAKVYFSRPSDAVRAVLILAPGQNSSGRHLLKESSRWRKFAEENALALCSYYFVSDDHLLRQKKGYFRAERESGYLLLNQIDSYFDGRKMPLLVHGVSGGAHFGSSLVDMFPDRFIFWSAYSAAWWIKPARHKSFPPGVVACGTEDALRFYPSFRFFQDGRRLGYRWTWVALKGMGHAVNQQYEDFLFHYMETVIHESASESGILSDINVSSPVTRQSCMMEKDEYMSWFPNVELKEIWSEIHEF